MRLWFSINYKSVSMWTYLVQCVPQFFFSVYLEQVHLNYRGDKHGKLDKIRYNLCGTNCVGSSADSGTEYKSRRVEPFPLSEKLTHRFEPLFEDRNAAFHFFFENSGLQKK